VSGDGGKAGHDDQGRNQDERSDADLHDSARELHVLRARHEALAQPIAEPQRQRRKCQQAGKRDIARGQQRADHAARCHADQPGGRGSHSVGQNRNDESQQPELARIVEVGGLPFGDVAQSPVTRINVAQRVEKSGRTRRRQHRRREGNHQEADHLPPTRRHRRATDHGEHDVQPEHAETDHVQPVHIRPQHEGWNGQPRPPAMLRAEGDEAGQQETEEQPRNRLWADGRVGRKEVDHQRRHDGQRQQRHALLAQRPGQDEWSRDADNAKKEGGAADAQTSGKPVHDQLTKPLMHYPRLVGPRVRERISTENAALGDETAGRDMPIIIAVDKASRRSQDSKYSGDGNRIDREWAGQAKRHRR